jgi:hypothetical protein
MEITLQACLTAARIGKNRLQVKVQIGFVAVKSVAVIGILPQKNLAWDLDLRMNGIESPFKEPAAAAPAPAGAQAP